jgi:hypothetical protein
MYPWRRIRGIRRVDLLARGNGEAEGGASPAPIEIWLSLWRDLWLLELDRRGR